jgi:hypothetical protein
MHERHREQDRSRKGTEEAFVAKLTHHATVLDCETVGAGHCAIMDFCMGKSTRSLPHQCIATWLTGVGEFERSAHGSRISRMLEFSIHQSSGCNDFTKSIRTRLHDRGIKGDHAESSRRNEGESGRWRRVPQQTVRPGIRGWACNNCDWRFPIHPNLAFTDAREVMILFDEHRCGDLAKLDGRMEFVGSGDE